MAKKVGFFEKVVTGLTGRTAEQRQADALMQNQVKQKQLASYRAEQLAQAENVGKAKADWEAQQQIKNLGKPKSLLNLDIGEYGKLQGGFNPMTFGTEVGGYGVTPAHQRVKGKIREMQSSAPKLFTLAEAMSFEGGSMGGGMKSAVRSKVRKHRVKHHRHKGKSGKKQSFTVTMR